MSLLEFADTGNRRTLVGPDSPAPVGGGNPSYQAVAIPAAGHVSPDTDLGAGRLHSILFPAGMPAVDITFDVSPDGANYGPLFSSGGEYALPAAVVGAGRLIAVDPSLFFAYRYIAVRTGTSGSVANQAAERDLILLTVPR